MHRTLSFAIHADASDALQGLRVVAQGIGPRRDAVFLATTPPPARFPNTTHHASGDAIVPVSALKAPFAATFVHVTGDAYRRVEIPEVATAYPLLQPLPDGEVLIVSARCAWRSGDPEKNGMVYGPTGELRRSFVLGDGIQDVQTTRDGRIWVSYFDEGVFGNLGWGEPLGASGLVCFDTHGRVLWKYHAPGGVGDIADCYALNVDDDAVWAYYYTDFPVVRIDCDFRVEAWPTDVAGSHALAVHRNQVLLFGGYTGERTRSVLLNLDSSRIPSGQRCDFRDQESETLAEHGRTVGRGSRLYAFRGATCFVFDLAD
jgi:hypothetical protein